MRVLLVEPDYHRDSASFIKKRIASKGAGKKVNDEQLWYPPLGLMKLAAFHKLRGDEVVFTRGFDKEKAALHPELFTPDLLWDRIYISTLFTFDWKKTVDTINSYKEAIGGTKKKIFVGGIMASLMPEELDEATEIWPVQGVLTSPAQIGLDGDENIDELPPDYEILPQDLYAVNDTYYGYTTRGCTNKCVWCGVPSIEPDYRDYIDIKPMVQKLRQQYGDKARLKLMDNNVLASPHLGRIVEDLLELDYGRGAMTNTTPKKQRTIDFNQGLDASHFNEHSIGLIAKLNIRPLRVAFDRIQEMVCYKRALRLAHKHGFREFSNYMLFGCNDTPRDLYDRLMVNIRLNEEWAGLKLGKAGGVVYSYPMRFAPIKSVPGKGENRKRDLAPKKPEGPIDYLQEAVWTKRFMRNIEIIKGAAHGAISPTASLAKRAIGETYEEFIANLYMPEELLRNRNKHEAKVYPDEPARPPGSGKVENFREFILALLARQDEEFFEFHEAVSENSKCHVRQALQLCKSEKVREWLTYYII